MVVVKSVDFVRLPLHDKVTQHPIETFSKPLHEDKIKTMEYGDLNLEIKGKSSIGEHAPQKSKQQPVDNSYVTVTRLGNGKFLIGYVNMLAYLGTNIDERV